MVHRHPWRSHARRSGVTLLATAAFALIPMEAALAEKRQFDIPAQRAAAALRLYGQQAGQDVIYSQEVVEGISTPALVGEFDSEDALERLLRGTGLRAVKDRGVVAIEREPRKSQVDPDTTPTPAATGAQSTSQADAGVLAEIIVTAQKREQRLQDVPLSIAVVSAGDIDRRGLVAAEDYLRGIPGANQVQGNTGQSIVIRGIETNTIFQGTRASATTATYFDETPTTDSAGLIGSSIDIKLVDIERVEVLRGPQGTAFGNSSMGGAVRTIPVSPDLEQVRVRAGVGYSVTSGEGGDNYNAQGVGNFPLIQDRLAVRAVGYRYEDSGFYRNEAASDPAFQAAFAAALGATAFAADDDEVGAESAMGGRISALFKATDALSFKVSYLTQDTQIDGWALANSGTYVQTLPQVAPEHVRRGEKAGVYDTGIEIVSGVAQYSFSHADVLATYSHLNGEVTFMQPYLATGLAWAASAGRDSEFRRDSGEIRLATKLDGAWNFLAGVYVESNQDDYLSTVYWFGDPATAGVTCGACVGQRLLLNALERRDLRQQAVFGEVSWEFLPEFTLTGGVRAYEYERTFSLDQSGPLGGGTPPPTRFDGDASGENFRANLSYKPHDDALVFAGWSQGFRFGRPQAGLSAALCDSSPADGYIDGTDISIESTRQIGPDEVDSYEVGAKVALLDRRVSLDVTAFRMDWSGMPVSVLYLSACPTGYTTNAGKARSEGIELQSSVQLTDELRMDLGGSYVRARLTEDVPAQRLFDGDRLPGSPEINANLGLQYGFVIGGREASVRADTTYVGDFYGDILESPNTKSGDYVKLDVSARVAFGQLDADLFVRNLTDEDDFTFRSAYSFTGPLYGYRMRPRTIGVQLNYAF